MTRNEKKTAIENMAERFMNISDLEGKSMAIMVIILLKDGIRTRSGDRCIVKNQIGVQFQMVIATLEPASY